MKATQQVKNYLLDLQNRICLFLAEEEPRATFIEDHWQHESGGAGCTRILEQGTVIEKAGVNFSHIQGKSLPQAATIKRPELTNAAFEALGVSVVVHPVNPYVPTSHFNVRYIQVAKADGELQGWFGGGFDLTPYYGFTEDVIHWHRMAKAACDPFGEEIYPTYKKACDDYFYLTHRQEARGVGGLFFDDLSEWDFEKSFAFMQSVSEHYIKAYQPILHNRKSHAFTKEQRDFQAYRRGRYVEFNLLYDRGTLFGLQSNGRIESILMSLPPKVQWKYAWVPEKNSPEERLYQEFLIPRDWV